MNKQGKKKRREEWREGGRIAHVQEVNLRKGDHSNFSKSRFIVPKQDSRVCWGVTEGKHAKDRHVFGI